VVVVKAVATTTFSSLFVVRYGCKTLSSKAGGGGLTEEDLYHSQFCNRAHLEGLAVIVSWEGERALGWACFIAKFCHRAHGGFGRHLRI
jgi:hypothetical protein